MGQNNQDDFKKGTVGYSAKYFKSQVLTALTEDLAAREEQGLPNEICEKVYAALNTTVSLTDNMIAGSFLTDDIHKSLIKFRDTYYNWNGVKARKGRQVLHDKLKEQRREIFNGFRKQMKTFKKDGVEEWDRQYTLLSDSDKGAMDDLSRTFNNVASEHGDIFKNLTKTLNTFQKINEEHK